jgi:transcriptional regulator with XRE-family HTH domain
MTKAQLARMLDVSPVTIGNWEKSEGPLNLRARTQKAWDNVLKSPKDWEAFARPIKNANVRRPAFQEEMARKVPGWKDLA